MATPSVFLRTVLLLVSALKFGQGQCTYGYTKVGNSCRYFWDCERYSCPGNERCLATQNGNKWCVYCVAGYQFAGNTFQCEDANDCKAFPRLCRNSNHCINNAGLYRCSYCPYGYRYDQTTFSCKDPSDCKAFPNLCGNTYSCINNAGLYRCGNCPQGFQYDQTTFSCQDVNECSSNPSLCNHGGCQNTLGSFRCNCDAGYTGQVCDQDASDCKVFPNLCGNNYNCIINNAGQYRCNNCLPGYWYHQTTFSCQDNDECFYDQSRCNHGSCQNTPGSFRCNCNAGYKGQVCNQDVDECSSNPSPCIHGSCQNTGGSFRCNCSAGYTGQVCDQDVNECSSIPYPCNHGSCQNTEGSFTCTCDAGYTGQVCDQDINECDSKPCQHGTCNNTEGSFQCDCSPGYIGTSCKTEVPDLYINSTMPPTATGERLKAMFLSEEWYLGPNITWTCTVEATDCSKVSVTVLLNITHDKFYDLSYFSLPGGKLPGTNGDAFKQATYTTSFNVELHRVKWSKLKFAYITVSANSSLTMACGRQASASTPIDACNHCQSSPCAENTTCQNIRGDFKCLCPEGFINALDYHTCAEKPDHVFDSQGGKQASGLEVRAMFSTASPAPEASKNWTCTVEAVDCSTQEVMLQFNVSEGYKASSFVSFPGHASSNESMSTENTTLQGSVAHYLEKRGKTPLYFMVGAARPVYVVLQASRNLTVMCGSNSQPAVSSSRCPDPQASQSSSPVLVPLIAGLVAAVVVIAIIAFIVVFKRKRLSAGKKGRGDNPVRFNDLRQREEDASAGAQPSQASGSTANQGAGAVYAVVNKPKGGKAGKASRVTPPAYAVVNKATPPPNVNSAASAADQIYSLASGDKPPPYHLAVATGPDMRAAAANRVAAQGTSQTAEDSTDYDVLGQNRRPSKPARDVTYGHLGEAVGDDDVDYGYDHTGVRSSGDVINGVYDTARAPSAPHDDVAADGTYDRMNLGQGQRKEVVGSTYDRVDPTYANSAFSAN